MKLVRPSTAVWTPQGDEHFSGEVKMASLATPDTEDGLLVLGVEFAGGARTDWHWHPGGQVLYVVAGTALVANQQGDWQLLGVGDTLQTPAGEWHWHGATPQETMTHLSLTSHGVTQWEDKVTDEQYAQVCDQALTA